MRHLVLSLVAVFCNFYMYAQVIVSPGTTMTVLPGTTLIDGQDLTIAGGANLVNQGDIIFKGNLAKYGSSELLGEFTAQGDDDQVIGGDSFSIRSLRINNAAGVTLESPLSITDRLLLDRGVLYTNNNNPVYFVGNAANPGETVDGYIQGTAIMDSRYINDYDFSFLGAELNISSLVEEIGMFGVKRITGPDAVTPIGDNLSISASWEIYRESPSLYLGYNEDAKFSWLPAFDNGKDLNDLILYGTSNLDPSKYVALDKKTANSITVDGVSQMRTYVRKSLDNINRKFTFAGRDVLNETVPPISITTYPNPATDHINFLLENFESWATDVVVKVTDVSGKLFVEKVFALDGNLITVDGLGFLPVGMYRAFISRGQITTLVNFMKN